MLKRMLAIALACLSLGVTPAAAQPAGSGVALWRLDCGEIHVTDLAVFHRPDHSSPFRLIELGPDVTADEVAAKTTARYES